MDDEDVALLLFFVAPVLFGAAAFLFVRRARRTPALGAKRVLRLVAGNVLVTAFLASSAALVIECKLRWGPQGTDSWGLLRSTSRWFDLHYKGNNFGFRDDQDVVVGLRDATRRRVTFVGDSFTAGHGVADVDKRFANLVRAARPQWIVDVCGQNGADTGDELKVVSETLPARGLSYDVVVLVYCLNDVGDILPACIQTLDRVRALPPRGVLASSSRLFDLLRLYSILASEPEIRDYFGSVAEVYKGGPVWDTQRARLRAIAAAAERHGGRLVVVTFPFMHDLGPSYRFRDAHRVLAEFWKSQGVSALDLLDTFQAHAGEDLVCSSLDAHPNERAHALAAEQILPFLDRVLTRR